MKLKLISVILIFFVGQTTFSLLEYYPIDDGLTFRYTSNFGEDEAISFHEFENKKNYYYRCYCKKNSENKFVPVACDTIKVCGKNLKYIYNSQEFLMFPRNIRIGDTLDIATETSVVVDYHDSFSLNGRKFHCVIEIESVDQTYNKKAYYAKNIGMIYIENIYGKKLELITDKSLY